MMLVWGFNVVVNSHHGASVYTHVYHTEALRDREYAIALEETEANSEATELLKFKTKVVNK